jgi:hypothetical protein
MQRRAAAIYFVFFLVVGAGAWAYIGVAEDTQRPAFSVSGHSFDSGQTQPIDGTEYTLSEIGGTGADVEGTLTWTNESGLHTATIENGSLIPYEGEEYEVVVANQTNVTSATLREYYNVTAILAQDDAVEDDLATRNGTEYVVYRDNQSIRPLESYLPERDVAEVATGDTLAYQGNETTVREITTEGMTVGWIAPTQMAVDLAEGGNVTLANDEQYFAHFPDNTTVDVVPIDQYPQYSETLAQQDFFAERLAGLWGIVILSGIAALFLLSVAYMPVRG